MGPDTGKKFNKDYQPDPERVKEGKAKKKLLKDILNTPLDGNGVHAKMIKLAAAYLQKDPSEITLAEIMHFRITQKAIQKQDVFAYQAVQDRAFGKPESKTTLANDENNPITPLSGDQVDRLLTEIKKAQK